MAVVSASLGLQGAGGLARAEPIGMSTSKDATDRERLAAQEVRRYVYLRTGELPGKTGQQGTIVIAQKNSPAVTDEAVRTASRDLQAQQYVLKTITTGGKKTWWIVGGDDTGTLYGAYRFAEKLGVRFYLHGDVIPDERIAAIPDMEGIGKPLFALRGVNPWGSHPFGFDAWGAEDYKAVITQLAKMRMNFIGMHCYPEEHPYAEPTVWHGLTGDFDASGKVSRSYVTRYFNTKLTPGWGDFSTNKNILKTGDYVLGGNMLFEDDTWAPDVMRGYCPLPETTEACNDIFNRMGAQFNDAFTFARQLGVKTCLGTEAPLIMPKVLSERTKDVRAVYEGTFRRIMASHPLDYYWIWTPEGWTWSGNKPAEYSNTVADIKLAIEALNNVKAPFELATAGWVLGPQHDRAALDNDLPENIPLSAISRNTGAVEVDPGFGRISGRERWAIPWLESDNREGLAGVQLFAGRMRRDAVDAREYGCTGLMGLHWRTDILAPNASALALAAWDQSWKINCGGGAYKDWQADIGKPRYLPCGDFYADFARANFGLEEVGEILASIDGKVPQVNDGGCPCGSLTPIAESRQTVAKQFEFVDQMEALRSRVQGKGNLDRFDYWLNTFKYIRSLQNLRCALAMPEGNEVSRLYEEAYSYLLATVNTPGALATVVTMETHPGWGPAVAKHVKQAWPKEYQGAPRIIVPCVRSVINKNESLKLKIMVLSSSPCKSVSVRVRPLGKREWQAADAKHVARGVWQAELPASIDDYEYYITAGDKLVWPATAPQLNQTVVVW